MKHFITLVILSEVVCPRGGQTAQSKDLYALNRSRERAGLPLLDPASAVEGVEVLRLRNCSALRSSYSAQDDNS
jgi:hypothetical protein